MSWVNNSYLEDIQGTFDLSSGAESRCPRVSNILAAFTILVGLADILTTIRSLEPPKNRNVKLRLDLRPSQRIGRRSPLMHESGST